MPPKGAPMPKAKSQAQYNLLAGVANGRITDTKITKSEARKGDSGVTPTRLPQRVHGSSSKSRPARPAARRK